MRIAIPKETGEGETRVALTPDVAGRLVRKGHEVVVEHDAGRLAGFLDGAYEEAGATIAPDAASTCKGADLVARIEIDKADIDVLPEGVVLVSFLYPSRNLDKVKMLKDARVTAFAMDCLPRITRAQSMDALSSMSTVAGYRIALLAAQHLGQFFPMLMTAAGTIPPARVVVVGAGVAGLQAIATARRLGAIVEAYDVREEAREQARSLGAESIEVDIGESGEGEGGYAKELSEEGKKKLEEKLKERIKVADAVITTALIPGKPAPRIISAATVAEMKPGAVIVDLAAQTGGNCELTVPGETVVEHDVKIVGVRNVPARMATDASRMYAKNVEEVIKHLTPPEPEEGQEASTEAVHLDFDDEITHESIGIHRGEIRHPRTIERLAEQGGGA